MLERTFAVIKPGAVANMHSGSIINLIELNKFSIIGMEKITMTQQQVETFYAVHKARPFFGEMVNSMISGPVVIMALEKENAINEWRDLMGATNPAQAAVGTLRRMFGTSIGSNATHGSDAPETAKEELAFFFPKL